MEAHTSSLVSLENAVADFCQGCSRSPLFGKTLVITGPNGTGKTHCLESVSNWISQVGRGIEYVVRPNHITHLQTETWHWPTLVSNLMQGQWELVEQLSAAGVLLVDELGGEYDPKKIGSEKFNTILSRRRELWTMITTNIEIDKWDQVFERRIASRLHRGSVIVDLSDVPDYSLWKKGLM